MNTMPPVGMQCRHMTDRDRGLCCAIKGLKSADPGKVRHRTRIVMPEGRTSGQSPAERPYAQYW
jgi:hypothetical protein